MILVTGAAGKTGRAILEALTTRGEASRALVHRSDQIQNIEDLGVHDIVVGDLRTRASVDQAVQGARAVYHICPNVSPYEYPIGKNIIDAARAAGVGHFVFHSVLHPQTEAMPHHWQKLRVEETLLESGVPFTIFQPAAYMQNILAFWEKISEEGVFPVPYAAETRLSLVDLKDVAQAAAVVLTESGHIGATYELVGTKATSQTEVAAILSQLLGHQVSIEVETLASWESRARASGFGDYQIEALIKMFRYYENYGFTGNPHVLRMLLQRPPTTLNAFVKREVKDRQKAR